MSKKRHETFERAFALEVFGDGEWGAVARVRGHRDDTASLVSSLETSRQRWIECGFFGAAPFRIVETPIPERIEIGSTVP